MAVMMPLAWAGCCWAWGFWMLRLPLRAWRNSVGLLEVGMVAREKEKERLEVGSRGLEPGSKNAGRAKVCAQRRESALALWCCSALLWRWGGVAEGRGGPILLSAFALQRGARAWAVRRAVVRAGRKSLKGSGAPSNRQSANRRSSRGAGQQPTEAGTERVSVAAWLAWAAPTSTGSWPQLLGTSTGSWRPSLFLHVRVVGRADSGLSRKGRVGQRHEQLWKKHTGRAQQPGNWYLLFNPSLLALVPTCKFESWGRR